MQDKLAYRYIEGRRGFGSRGESLNQMAFELELRRRSEKMHVRCVQTCVEGCKRCMTQGQCPGLMPYYRRCRGSLTELLKKCLTIFLQSNASCAEYKADTPPLVCQKVPRPLRREAF